jgi:cation:H+ antiporter
MNIFVSFGVLVGAFLILLKSADIFVDSAVNIAEILSVPKMIIGIVLVGFATTAPEFAVSVQSAYLGHPEIALGNAVGSVICDDALAMALAAILAPVPILIDSRILKSAGIFLISIDIMAYAMSLNGIFGRLEGSVLVLLLVGYIYFVYSTEKKRRGEEETIVENGFAPSVMNPGRSLRKQLILFLVGLAGVVIASRLTIWSCINIARYFAIPEVIIGLTIIAIGTSLPEISTCVTAARKGEGEIAAGDIIGADILNVLWIIGVSSVVNPMHVSTKIINFMFPWMLLIVGTMLLSMRINYRMGKAKGVILLVLYLIYITMTIKVFY